MTNIAAASFETMHVYGVDRPYSILEPWHPRSVNFNDPQNKVFETELRIGQQIQKYLEWKFWSVQRLWFHDDVYPRMQQKVSQDNWPRWEQFIQVPPEQVKQVLERQWIPRSDVYVQNEFDLTWEATETSIPEIIESVKHSDTWRFDSEKNMLRWPNVKVWKKKKQSRIRLKWYRDYDDLPSCEVLDYTFYKKRLEMSTPTITLISENMRWQQEKVRQLFTLRWESPEVIVMYHDWEKIINGDYWGEW
jgi:hypothetical protein